MNSQTWECLRNFQGYFEPEDAVYKAIDIYFAQGKACLTQAHKNALNEIRKYYGKPHELYVILCEMVR